MASESLIDLLPLTEDIIKTVVLIVLILAVYTAHLDIQVQLLRYNRRKLLLQTKPTFRNRPHNTYKRFSIISDVPRTTSSFRNPTNKNILPIRSHSSSHLNLPDIYDLPPPAEDL